MGRHIMKSSSSSCGIISRTSKSFWYDAVKAAGQRRPKARAFTYAGSDKA